MKILMKILFAIFLLAITIASATANNHTNNSTTQNNTTTVDLEIDYDEIRDIIRENSIRHSDIRILLDEYCSPESIQANITGIDPYLNENGTLNPILQKVMENAISNEIQRQSRDHIVPVLKNQLFPARNYTQSLEKENSYLKANQSGLQQSIEAIKSIHKAEIENKENEITRLQDEMTIWQIATGALAVVMIAMSFPDMQRYWRRKRGKI